MSNLINAIGLFCVSIFMGVLWLCFLAFLLGDFTTFLSFLK